MTEIDKAKQFDFTKDAVSTVITLSSGILALSLTFSKEWANGTQAHNKVWLQTAWGLLLASIVAGIICLLVLAGFAHGGEGNIRRPIIRVPWLGQLLSFLLGLGFLTAFGVMEL